MKAREHTYGRDEVIFREGEPSEAVFVVVSGRVELSKMGPEGPVLLAVLGPLDMFGEMGALDDNPRSASARAADKSRIKVIPKEEFKGWLEQDPDAAYRVMKMMAERLRAANAVIARQNEIELVAASPAKISLVGALMSWFRRKRRSGGPSAEVSTAPFQVGVAVVNNDIDNAWSRALVDLLAAYPGLAVRLVSGSVEMDGGIDQPQVNTALLKARQLLAGEGDLDLLLWGDVHADGYTLWLTPSGSVDDDRPGTFGPYFKLELPGDQEPPAGELLYLTVLAAIEPGNDPQRANQRQLLLAAQQAMPPFPGGLPVSWNMEQQRTGLACYGHAAASLAALEGEADWYDKAAEAYKAALLRLPRGEHGIEEALLRKHLGGILQNRGDRRQDTALLEQAVEEFRNAVECLLKSAYPQEWGSAQNRLGVALYKLDLVTGQTSLLKEAMTAFQSALQMFPRADAPQRWADVMNNLAQVLQVYGDQMKSPEVLERAVEACRAALDFRLRTRTPLAWAASQNTLGTALFLLDKHSRSSGHLEEAATAFKGALEVYRQMGAARLAAVAEKNLSHVEKLGKLRGERRPAIPDWADEGS